MKKVSLSIGIFAHNEENGIAKCLQSVANQNTEVAQVSEIFVISSASYDRTNEIVRKAAKKDKRIKLIEEFKREGKSAAINLFLTKSKGNVVVLVGADLRLHRKALEEIALPFLDDSVGMVGAHPVPCNVSQSSIGREIDVLWKLHHHISLSHPKCGEMVAFRKVIRQIPKKSAVDEATIEVLLKLIGYKIVYAPRSIVYNKIPKTVGDFLTQRRRVYAGHKWVINQYNYEVSTLSITNSLHAIYEYSSIHPEDIIYLVRLMALEFAGRVLGWVDYFILDRNPYVWKMVER